MSSKGSNTGSISLYSLSLPKSITEQTKDRFDAILKSALKKKKSKSKEKLLDEKASTSASSSNLLYEEIEEDIQEETEFVENLEFDDEEEKESKSYMLNKFFNDTSQDEVTVIKPPIPKPRTKISETQRRDSVSSGATYNVETEETLEGDKEKPNPTRREKGNVIQIQPNEKLKVIKTKGSYLGNSTLPEIKPDNEKNQTKNQEIGDLVLHDSPSGSKIKVVASQNEILKKADHETLSDDLSSRTSSSRQTFTVKKSRKKKENNQFTKEPRDLVSEEEISENDSNKKTKENIETYIIEPTKPTPAKRNLNKNVTQTDSEQNKEELNYDHITEIIIHKTDKLMLNSFIIHPVIKVHIVDMKTEKYYKKSDKNRSVVFYYENDSNDYILPVMSSFYNLQEKRTFYPIWEETILLNEDFEYLLNENVLIFFELLDFAPSNSGSLQKRKDFDKGWFKIAFAFLKPVGKNHALNVNKQVRLQLFFPPNIIPKNLDSDKCYLFDHWGTKKMKKYPSTLYVTVKKAISPKRVIDTFRSKSALQREEISSNYKQENEENLDADEHLKKDIENFKTKWLKTGNNKNLPRECIETMETFDDGCFIMKFSNGGQYLACSIKVDEDFCIIVYKVENFKEKTRFKNHQKLIYSIVWSSDDSLLLTASADNTVSIWDFEKHLFLQILPHPSFVYTCDVNGKNTVATGGYDNTIRIWNFNSKKQKFNLTQELESHKKYITCLCFSRKSGEVFWSADAGGEILEWESREIQWNFKRKIEILDLKETVINQIVLFQNEKKMVVHSRDSALRIISLANSCVIHWLYGALNTRVQTFCDISPCGFYVICGSENGLIIVWDTKTSKDVKTYEALVNKSKTVHCVQFHPKIGMFAGSHYGSKEPILIYGSKEEQENGNYKENVDKKEVEDPSKGDFEEKKIDFRRILRKMDEILID